MSSNSWDFNFLVKKTQFKKVNIFLLNIINEPCFEGSVSICFHCIDHIFWLL